MKAIVVYESLWGSTAAVARAITLVESTLPAHRAATRELLAALSGSASSAASNRGCIVVDSRRFRGRGRCGARRGSRSRCRGGRFGDLGAGA